MKKNKAFTLAEVLVTLMIIGVIAAVTIPTLNQNIKNNQYVAGVLKADSVLSQAINRMKVEYGPVGFGKAWNNKADFMDAFIKQFNSVKTCSEADYEDCYDFKHLIGTDGKPRQDISPRHVILATDGMMYSTVWVNSRSIVPGWVSTYGMLEEDTKNVLAKIMVDVNGEKGPNRYGRDIFFFLVIRGKGVLPVGYANDISTARVIKHKKID